MTVVQPRLQSGVAELNGDGQVRGFTKTPRSEHQMLEREPLERLAAEGQLRAFRHEGFWDCMDTYKDAVLLNDLWGEGRAPWKLWT